MTETGATIEEIAKAVAPLRRLCFLILADAIDLAIAGASSDEIETHIENVLIETESQAISAMKLLSATAEGHA